MSGILARRKPLLAFANAAQSAMAQSGPAQSGVAQSGAAQAAATATIATSPHPIAEVRAFQVGSAGSPGAYVVLQVRTRSGLVGHGECNALSSADLKAVNQAVAGRAASSYRVLEELVPVSARGGLNIALLDILGQATKAPIYRVLGGPTRFKARAIARLSGSSDEELQGQLQTRRAAGFRAFLIPIPAPAARNQGSEFIHLATARLRTLRAAAPDADFAFEAQARLTPGDAASLATAIESMHPLWLDEPCPVNNLETIHKIADETVVPLGFGRTIADPGTFQDMLREGLVDLLRPDLLTYGITGVRRIAAMAETYYIDLAPWHNGGPIADAAALHAAASIPNFFIAQANSPAAPAPLDGFFDLPKGPGLGIDIDLKSFEGNPIL